MYYSTQGALAFFQLSSTRVRGDGITYPPRAHGQVAAWQG